MGPLGKCGRQAAEDQPPQTAKRIAAAAHLSPDSKGPFPFMFFLFARSAGPGTVSCSWFLLAQSKRACSIRARNGLAYDALSYGVDQTLIFNLKLARNQLSPSGARRQVHLAGIMQECRGALCGAIRLTSTPQHR